MSSSPTSVTTASVVSGAVASSPYFSSDRAAKYGWGLPRLVLVCLIAFELAPRASSAISPASQAALGLLPYLRSGRWIGHLYIGSIGAAVNVQIRSFTFNLCMLIGAAALIVFDLRLDYAILIYMLKTFSGDFIAGKLDTLEWRLVLLFTGLVAVAAWQLEAANAPVAFQPYTRILPVLATVQLICELGDAHLEHWLFFRHRYSFEVLSLLVLFGLQLTSQELPPVQHDLVICLGYRAANLAIILARSGELMEASRRLAFHLLGLLSGTRIQVVSDVTVAMAVLRGSSLKGHALERLIASPAWPSGAWMRSWCTRPRPARQSMPRRSRASPCSPSVVTYLARGPEGRRGTAAWSRAPTARRSRRHSCNGSSMAHGSGVWRLQCEGVRGLRSRLLLWKHF
jgi:hypothetical protein